MNIYEINLKNVKEIILSKKMKVEDGGVLQQCGYNFFMNVKIIYKNGNYEFINYEFMTVKNFIEDFGVNESIKVYRVNKKLKYYEIYQAMLDSQGDGDYYQHGQYLTKKEALKEFNKIKNDITGWSRDRFFETQIRLYGDPIESYRLKIPYY